MGPSMSRALLILNSLKELSVKGFFLVVNMGWNFSVCAWEEMGFVGLCPCRLQGLGQRTGVLWPCKKIIVLHIYGSEVVLGTSSGFWKKHFYSLKYLLPLWASVWSLPCLRQFSLSWISITPMTVKLDIWIGLLMRITVLSVILICWHSELHADVRLPIVGCVYTANPDQVAAQDTFHVLS